MVGYVATVEIVHLNWKRERPYLFVKLHKSGLELVSDISSTEWVLINALTETLVLLGFSERVSSSEVGSGQVVEWDWNIFAVFDFF